MKPIDASKEINSLIKKQELIRNKSINLVSSENLTSPEVRLAVSSDFMHRYMLSGTQQFDAIHRIAEQVGKELFSIRYIDFRAISGHVADLIIMNALSKNGDNVMMFNDSQGGHPIDDACLMLGRRPIFFGFNSEEYNIDIEKTIKRIEKENPSLLVFNSAYLLFPHPINEISKITDACICYDASHPLGLIAGKQYPHPLKEGADVMIGGTQKTLWGTQKALIMSDDFDVMNEIIDKSWRLKNPFAGNKHYHHIVGLAIALCEFAEYGEEYAKQVIKNAKSLGQNLSNLGFKVLCPNKGFTETQTIMVDVASLGGGVVVRDLLDKANITTSALQLPKDRKTQSKSGIRIGTPEVTRLGMKESEMAEIAKFIKSLIIDNKDAKIISKEIAEFRNDFQTIYFCFRARKYGEG